MGIPLIAGRTFAESDSDDGPGVAIASEALARKYWPGENPVGKHLRFDQNDPWMTVVGLVADVRQLGLSEPPTPLLYIPYQQFALPFTNVTVRSTLAESAVTSLMRKELAAADPDLPYGDLMTLQSVVDRSVDEPRFRTLLIGIFAVLALLLAAVGVYGLISYSVTQRTQRDRHPRRARRAASPGPVPGRPRRSDPRGDGRRHRPRRRARADPRPVGVPLRRRRHRPGHLRARLGAADADRRSPRATSRRAGRCGWIRSPRCGRNSTRSKVNVEVLEG